MWRHNVSVATKFQHRRRSLRSRYAEALPCDGAEARADVAAIGREEVAIAVVDHPSPRRPGAAAQHLAGAEPGRGVVLVDVGREPGKRIKGARRPFPGIADHLPAAPGAVAGGAGADVDAAKGDAVEIGPRWTWRGLAPRERALVIAQWAVGRWLGGGRRLPFDLGRQPAAGPPAPGIGLVPVDVDDWLVRRQCLGTIEAAHLPATVALRLPIDGMLGLGVFAPVPAFVVPQGPLAIAAGFDERGELGVGDRRAGDAEGTDCDRMRPFLIVEDERCAALRAELEAAGGNVHVARPWPGAGVGRCAGAGETRLRICKGLARIGEGLVVHILVERGELV